MRYINLHLHYITLHYISASFQIFSREEYFENSIVATRYVCHHHHHHHHYHPQFTTVMSDARAYTE